MYNQSYLSVTGKIQWDAEETQWNKNGGGSPEEGWGESLVPQVTTKSCWPGQGGWQRYVALFKAFGIQGVGCKAGRQPGGRGQAPFTFWSQSADLGYKTKMGSTILLSPSISGVSIASMSSTKSTSPAYHPHSSLQGPRLLSSPAYRHRPVPLCLLQCTAFGLVLKSNLRE